MPKAIRRSTEWLAPLPEVEYLRVIYYGELQLCSRDSESSEKDINTNSLEDMISDIWTVSMICNRKHNVSGHLSYSKGNHVCQLIEGKADAIRTLMKNIRKDPRVIIHSELKKTILSMNLGWNISRCYTFEPTMDQYKMIADVDTTPEQMFNNMKKTLEILHEGGKLKEFYKMTVDTFLFKYISIEEKVKYKRIAE